MHKYPFLSMLKLSTQETNLSPVRLSIKRPTEFTNPQRLNVLKVKVTKAEQLKPFREQTKGYFQNDPDLQMVIKDPGELRQKEYIALISRNETVSNYFKRKRMLEEKSLHVKHAAKVYQQNETCRIMEQSNRTFVRANYKKLIAMFMKERQ